MSKNSHILIVGAGPAGASLAIRLAQKNFRVTLIEREKFPRQKLCGEFISPECLRHFRELGVLSEMAAAGGQTITETFFYAPGGKSISIPSKWFNAEEAGALSLSRAEMDFRLMEKAKKIGVEVLEEHSVVNLLAEKDKIRGLVMRTKDGDVKEFFADLYVDATGRPRVLGKLAAKKFQTENTGERKIKLQSPKTEISRRLVGFKVHLKNARLQKGCCEIYFFEGGYGGLSVVENDLANFCFLIRADAVKKFSSDVQQILEKVVFQNTRARETLKAAEPVHDWLAVAVDGFGQKDLIPAKNLFAVGDAGAFIDPFTGSGMVMAFESAEILANVVAENYFSPAKIAESYTALHNEKFRRRLRICSLMRRAAFVPALAKTAIFVLSSSVKLREVLARATRQNHSINETE